MQRQAIYIPSISLLSFTHPFYRFEVAGFQSLSKWSLFWQDQAAANMNGISQSRVKSYATEWRGREDIFRTYNCNLICKLSANSCHVIARNVSATNAVQTQELHASVYLSLVVTVPCTLLLATLQHSTGMYCTVHTWWRTRLPRPRGQDSSSSVDRQSVAVRSLKMRGGEMLKLCYNCNWAVIQFEN